MPRVFKVVIAISKWMHWIAGAALMFLLLVTISDVALRQFGKSLIGTLDMVGLAGGIAIAFALPYTSLLRGQVYVDSFLNYIPKGARKITHLITRIAGIILFIALGCSLIIWGMSVQSSGEATPTLEFRFYPIVYAVAFAAFVQAVVLVCHIAMIFRGEYE